MRSEQEIADFFTKKILTAQKTIRDAFREIRSMHGVNISKIVRKIKQALQDDDDAYSDYGGVPLPDKPDSTGKTYATYIKDVMDYVISFGEFPPELDPDVKYIIVMLLSQFVAGRNNWCEYAYKHGTPDYTSQTDPSYSIGPVKLYFLAYDAFDALYAEMQPSSPNEDENEDERPSY